MAAAAAVYDVRGEEEAAAAVTAGLKWAWRQLGKEQHRGCFMRREEEEGTLGGMSCQSRTSPHSLQPAME